MTLIEAHRAIRELMPTAEWVSVEARALTFEGKFEVRCQAHCCQKMADDGFMVEAPTLPELVEKVRALAARDWKAEPAVDVEVGA